MLRAFGDEKHPQKSNKGQNINFSQKVLVSIFAPLTIATFVVTDLWFSTYTIALTFTVFLAGIAFLLAALVLNYAKVSLSSTGYAVLCYVYPSLFLLVLSVCNHLSSYSELSILFVFVICPAADSLAYVFGRLLGKKFPAKMSPHVSPNKTMVGGIGGLIGGALGGVVLFFAYYGVLGTLSTHWIYIIFFIELGVLTALFTEFGDLVESAIKRKLGIKDMGKLLPGHGGILDRIDSTLYASLIVALVFVICIMIIG
jgi:phosphatidate cytidylyltransferase